MATAAARLSDRGGVPDLVFVGRSPESLYDHLRGLCRGTHWSARLHLLHFSMRDLGEGDVRRLYLAGLPALRSYLTALGLDPASLPDRPRPAVLVDLVCHGWTFGNLVTLLRRWCGERGMCWDAARRNLRLVGMTVREKKKPGGYRWHEHGPGVARLGRGAARSVPVPMRLWDYLGNRQPKVAESYPPQRWGKGGGRTGRPGASTTRPPCGWQGGCSRRE